MDMEEGGIGYNAEKQTFFYKETRSGVVIGTKYKEFDTLEKLISFVMREKFSEKAVFQRKQ